MTNEGKHEGVRKVISLKEGDENVSLLVRVLDVGQPRVIQTAKGPRTISEALLGDETGRVKATFWGEKAGRVSKGDVVKITGAWVTSFRGELHVNVGSRSLVESKEDSEAPLEDEIPQASPEASAGRTERRGRPGGRGSWRRGRGGRP